MYLSNEKQELEEFFSSFIETIELGHNDSDQVIFHVCRVSNGFQLGLHSN